MISTRSEGSAPKNEVFEKVAVGLEWGGMSTSFLKKDRGNTGVCAKWTDQLDTRLANCSKQPRDNLGRATGGGEEERGGAWKYRGT